MTKSKSQFICQSCGYASPRWLGKCPDCGSWNQFVEEIKVAKPSKASSGSIQTLALREVRSAEEIRMRTGIHEFDRVLGGGIVTGGVLLIGGAPGMGKSTLLLQIGHALSMRGKQVLYVSGEESLQQIKIRADRLGISDSDLKMASESQIESVIECMEKNKPDAAIIDSIQTMQSGLLDTLAGNVNQVRFCGALLTRAAKKMNIPVLMTGHITKDGQLAGPRVLEHLVDGLFIMEGDGQHLYRLFRSLKNRYGSINEVGIFEMADDGLKEVLNPSAHLIAQKQENISGSVIAVSLEGTRPLLVEIQALVTPTSYGIPQRTANGIDPRRLSMLLAVLEKRLGERFGNQDVFVNVAGGLRLLEPGIDLAVALALLSSLRDKPIPGKLAAIGEVGLSGEIRTVSHIELRIGEAERMGFESVLVPRAGLKETKRNLKLIAMDNIRDVYSKMFQSVRSGNR